MDTPTPSPHCKKAPLQGQICMIHRGIFSAGCSFKFVSFFSHTLNPSSNRKNMSLFHTVALFLFFFDKSVEKKKNKPNQKKNPTNTKYIDLQATAIAIKCIVKIFQNKIKTDKATCPINYCFNYFIGLVFQNAMVWLGRGFKNLFPHPPPHHGQGHQPLDRLL